MHHYQLNNFQPDIFLKKYWQKKPAVFRQAFKGFVDPLDENELAGLAQEPDIDSRIVSRAKQKWSVAHGPFENFSAHCKGNWSLLVQSVDHYVTEADELMQAFNFIPNWRMDDLMVSFSNQGAGVGPHLDQYDVFIIQGKGSRRWQVGAAGEYAEIRPHKDLGQINHFEPLIDEVLQAGDMLYIPPGCPHNGVALEDCLNYSVGFRAPTQQELLSSFADYAIDFELFNQRYQDPDLTQRPYSGEMTRAEIKNIKQLMLQAFDSAHFETWLAKYMSKSNLADSEEQQEQLDYTEQQVAQLLSSNTIFYRQVGLRPTFLQTIRNDSSDFSFYVHGEEFCVPGEIRERTIELLNSPQWQEKISSKTENSLFFIQIMTKLVNSGYWYPE